MTALSTQPLACFSHPTVDSSCRFALDSLLRKHGFTIWQRKGKRLAALWRKGKRLFTYLQALACIPQSDVQDAQYAEELYLHEKYSDSYQAYTT